MNKDELNLLLVEDNEDHAELVKRSLSGYGVIGSITHMVDGRQAIDYLFHNGEYSQSKPDKPDLILLDLRLPKIDGIDVLKSIKSSDELKQIPVVILTTSEAENDLAAAYSNHANSYLVKPIGFADFKELLDQLGFYWLSLNAQPSY